MDQKEFEQNKKAFFSYMGKQSSSKRMQKLGAEAYRLWWKGVREKGVMVRKKKP